jgi:hypothetical protein
VAPCYQSVASERRYWLPREEASSKLYTFLTRLYIIYVANTFGLSMLGAY